MTLRIRLVLILLLSAPASTTFAANLTCKGTVTDLAHTATGELRIKPIWRGDWVTLCNTSVAWKGIPIEVCKLWQAQALAAQITQAGTITQYDNITATVCSSISTYGNADAATFFANY
jgi:hypothetical protein